MKRFDSAGIGWGVPLPLIGAYLSPIAATAWAGLPVTEALAGQRYFNGRLAFKLRALTGDATYNSPTDCGGPAYPRESDILACFARPLP
jgi:hypothetical protein